MSRIERAFIPQAVGFYEDPYGRFIKPIPRLNPQPKSVRTLTHLERYIRREGERDRVKTSGITGRRNIGRV